MVGKRVAFFALLAVVAQVNPAHAITPNLSVGSATNSSTGTVDGGSFTTTPYTDTTTFNSATATATPCTGKSCTPANTYTYTPTFSDPSAPTLTYTWTSAGTTSIRSDQYAPPPPNGQAINTTAAASGNNTTKYLAVFQNAPVTITSSKFLSYFGMDLGYVDADNQLDFYNGSTLLNTFTGSQLFGSTNQGSSYVDFVSNNTSSDFFNKIVITEPGGTGFESDNHAVKVAPAPSQVSGILALGLMGAWQFYKGNRKQKQKQLAIK